MSKPSLVPSPTESSSAIDVIALRFGYEGGEVLRGIDARMPFGAVTALTGANGAGKSTLLELIAGILVPDSGTIHRAGGRLALVVQRPRIAAGLQLTVRDVVRIGCWGRGRPRADRTGERDAIEVALERVGLSGIADRRLGAVSGGQRQRALLAQGLVQHAAILVLDEPAAGLDAESRGFTMTALAEEASRGAAVVQASHDLEAIAASDRVLRLEGGRMFRER